MPAYYWMQLYKDPAERNIQSIVELTVDGLLSAGCTYQLSQVITINDDSLPQIKQVPIRRDQAFEIDEAIQYAVHDIESWVTTEKRKKWLPGIKLIFTYDFQFDLDISTKLGEDKLKEVSQVTLNFWVQKDSILKKSIVMIDLDTWEEYVLMYGKGETHEYNKQQILKIVATVCEKVCPHFGWLDGEWNSNDYSYGLLAEGELPVANDYVVIGPQLSKLLPVSNIEQSPHFVERLVNGVVILHGRM